MNCGRCRFERQELDGVSDDMTCRVGIRHQDETLACNFKTIVTQRDEVTIQRRRLLLVDQDRLFTIRTEYCHRHFRRSVRTMCIRVADFITSIGRQTGDKGNRLRAFAGRFIMAVALSHIAGYGLRFFPLADFARFRIIDDHTRQVFNRDDLTR